MITHHELAVACEHAAQWKRQMAIDAGAPGGNIRERIVTIPKYLPEIVGDGWVKAGHIADTDCGAWLEVWLEPATGRIGVECEPDDAGQNMIGYTTASHTSLR